MSAAESSPHGLDQLHFAQQALLSSENRDQIMLITPTLLPVDQANTFHRYGFGGADVFYADGRIVAESYLIDPTTPEMQKIDEIQSREADGSMPEGTTYQAISDLLTGTFHEQWMTGSTEPRQTD